MTDANSLQKQNASALVAQTICAAGMCFMLLLLCVPAFTIAFAMAPVTWLETIFFSGLFAAIAGIALVARGPAQLAKRAAGRIALASLAAATAMAMYAPFHLLAAGVPVKDSIAMLQFGPIFICVMFWGFGLFADGGAPEKTGGPAERLEAFLKSPGTRFNLFLVALLALPAMASASGLSLFAALWPVAFAGALMLAFGELLSISGTVRGAWTIVVVILLGSGWAAVDGYRAYAALKHESEQAVADMAQGRPDLAQGDYDRTLKLSAELRTNDPRIGMETGLAQQYEKQNNPAFALAHWKNVATLTHAAPETFAPIQRVQCAMGDSLAPWRTLVFEGFPAIDNAEMAPGIARLAAVVPDVRAKLLAALLAWNRNAPEAERRTLLEAVQKVSPGEPSSLNLLKRLGGPIRDAPMWLPPELIVGTVPTYQSDRGTIEELGEVSTLVCLNPGHWEMSLRASGTPLHEEWPVVRVEMNGLKLATTQVNKSAEHDVPFTFDVTRNDIFKVKIVFQNHQEDLEEGRTAARGLKILGIKFSQAKN